MNWCWTLPKLDARKFVGSDTNGSERGYFGGTAFQSKEKLALGLYGVLGGTDGQEDEEDEDDDFETSQCGWGPLGGCDHDLKVERVKRRATAIATTRMKRVTADGNIVALSIGHDDQRRDIR